jgi:thioredoxin-related protein
MFHDTTCIFCSLAKQRNYLLDKIDDVNAQFRHLRIAYREEKGVKMNLDTHHSKTSFKSFKEGWSPLGKDYDALKEFCGNLAGVMPGTSSMESDFLLINWTRDPYSNSLTDFSLEAILHGKQ